jgi:hypothetical protein
MRRRDFLRTAAAGSAAAILGPAAWDRVLAASPPLGVGPYGPLQAPDNNGLRLPKGFRSRVIARSGLPVPNTLFLWPVFPDGAACFPTDDGGWILCVNSEAPPPIIDLPIVVPPALSLGGASAIRFGPTAASRRHTRSFGTRARTAPAGRRRGIDG